jgi:hypothetical protein
MNSLLRNNIAYCCEGYIAILDGDIEVREKYDLTEYCLMFSINEKEKVNNLIKDISEILIENLQIEAEKKRTEYLLMVDKMGELEANIKQGIK